MECDWVKNNLSGFLDEELAEDDRKVIRNHLLQCRDCEEELVGIRRLKEILGTMKREVPEEVRRSVRLNLEALRFGLIVSHIREFVLIVAATLGVLLLLLFLLPRYQATREIAIRFIEPYENLHRSLSGQQFEPAYNHRLFEINTVDYPVSRINLPPGKD
ncbi:MAG TPA: zf-HC2 domain-containing protein [Atribacteraceae bacterium]|nr:zf-HC2 domain-containing protein [Atribacteraceae bacterium]